MKFLLNNRERLLKVAAFTALALSLWLGRGGSAGMVPMGNWRCGARPEYLIACGPSGSHSRFICYRIDLGPVEFELK